MRDEPANTTEDWHEFADGVRRDHYLHWAALVGAGAFAWQVHGLLAGITAVVSQIIVISVLNMWLLASGRSHLVNRNRWLWVIATYLIVALSGASGGTTGH